MIKLILYVVILLVSVEDTVLLTGELQLLKCLETDNSYDIFKTLFINETFEVPLLLG